MNTEQELLRAVISNAEDDAARLAYADYIQTWEPDRAAFIREQVAEARPDRINPRALSRRSGKSALLGVHEREWTRTIAKYATEWKFDRGFVTEIAIDPYLFLEYGDWLLINAPIRAVEFIRPEQGEFPMKEVSSSPLLERLDRISFRPRNISDSDLRLFAESPHLEQVVAITAARKRLDLSVYEAFAAARSTRKALSLFLSEDGFPGQSYEPTGDYYLQGNAVWGWMPIKPEGEQLESKYGYIPWLHRGDNDCDVLDAAYYVQKGVLPVRPAGSPVDPADSKGTGPGAQK